MYQLSGRLQHRCGQGLVPHGGWGRKGPRTRTLDEPAGQEVTGGPPSLHCWGHVLLYRCHCHISLQRVLVPSPQRCLRTQVRKNPLGIRRCRLLGTLWSLRAGEGGGVGGRLKLDGVGGGEGARSWLRISKRNPHIVFVKQQTNNCGNRWVRTTVASSCTALATPRPLCRKCVGISSPSRQTSAEYCAGWVMPLSPRS